MYRLLRAIETDVFVTAIERLLNQEMSAQVTREAVGHLQGLFAQNSGARGSVMAGAAEELVGDPVAVSESVALLAHDLVEALDT